MRILPAIDLLDGRCVRLFQGDFGRRTEYGDLPGQIAADYRTMGFRHLHLVDLDGARQGKPVNRELVGSITGRSGLSVQLGGGIRRSSVIDTWLDSGVDRCVIGSLAVTHPDKVRGWLSRYGPERIVLALDVRLDDRGTPLLATHGWTRTSDVSLWHCVDDYVAAGLSQVLCTDVSRDGALSGPNLTLYEEFAGRYPGIGLQASGGIRHVADLEALQKTGAGAAITGRALLDGRITAKEISPFLQSA